MTEKVEIVDTGANTRTGPAPAYYYGFATLHGAIAVVIIIGLVIAALSGQSMNPWENFGVAFLAMFGLIGASQGASAWKLYRKAQRDVQVHQARVAQEELEAQQTPQAEQDAQVTPVNLTKPTSPEPLPVTEPAGPADVETTTTGTDNKDPA